MSYSPMISQDTITVVFNNGERIKQIARDHVEAVKVLDAIRNRVEDETLLALFDKAEAVRQHFGSELEVREGTIWYNGEPVHNCVVTRIFEFIQNGIPATGLINFLKKLMGNVSRNSIEQLYRFLEHKNLPICESGDVVAYKGVSMEGWSIHADKHAPLIQGVMDDDGHIRNWVGDVNEVRRGYVADDPNVHCHSGLHIGSLEYGKSFGPRTVLCKFNPADAVSVPNDCNCQKLRVCKYQVIGEYERPLSQSDVTPGCSCDGYTPTGPFSITVYGDDGQPVRVYEDLDSEDEVDTKLDQLKELGFDDVCVFDADGEACTEHFT